MKRFNLWTRREFLQSTIAAGLSSFCPAFLARSAQALQGQEESSEGRILVVLQLGGGNDGLNTVIPFTDDRYSVLRPSLAVPTSQQIRLTHDLALHSALHELKELYDDGRASIVNGVGYPNPDRSHFRSMEIWQTASDSNRFESRGWLGRYFDNCCPGTPDALMGINVGPELEQAFSGTKGVGVAFQSPGAFKWVGESQSSFESLNTPVGKDPQSNLEFLRHVSMQAAVSSERIQKAARYKRESPQYPHTKLGADLKIVADMIAGGLPSRVYYVSHTGFDTHANQSGQHQRLLEQFSQAVAAFQRDLSKLGRGKDVITLCFSEFGRRAEENASRGTDHGTAGPLFLIGEKVDGGVVGRYPSLDRLDQGDLIHSVDFRSVYSAVLQDWLKVDSQLVLGARYPAIKLISA